MDEQIYADDHKVFDVDALKQQIETIDDMKDEQEEEEDTEISLGTFGKIVGKKAIKVSGLKSTLGLVQDILILVNDGADFIKNVCEWEDGQIHIASMMVIGLFSLCLLSIILRDTNFSKYEVYLIGMCVLTWYSKP
eukprot:326349_1